MIGAGLRSAGHFCRKVSVETVLTITQALVPAKTSRIRDEAKLNRSIHERGYPSRIIAKVSPMNRKP